MKFLSTTGLTELITKIKSWGSTSFVSKTDVEQVTEMNIDSTPTSSSTNLVTSGGVKTALDAKQNTLTAGTNITIANDTISALVGGDIIQDPDDASGGKVTASTLADVDSTLTISGNAADAKVTGDEIRGIKGDLGNKVDKVTGKGLSANDFTNSYKSQLDDSAIPSYVITEAESTIAKSFSHGNLGKTIRFIAVSDSHNDANNMGSSSANIVSGNKHCGQAVKYIADRIGLDFVAVLGDSTWAGTAQTADQYNQAMLRADIQQFNDFIAEGYKNIPNVRIAGNHDQLYTTSGTPARLWNSGAYNLFGRYCDGKKDTVGGYGYLDLESANVRIIYLNTSDIPSATTAGTYLGMTQAQKNWLCETLIDVNTKTDASAWKILIVSHAPLDLTTGVATDILVPYTNGGTYGNYTFTNHDAKILANVHGHMHCYSYGYMGNKIRRFTIPNSNFIDNNHYAGRSGYEAWTDVTTYPKTANTGDDTSFSLVTIDLDSNMCYVDNYGAGVDREFSCDYYTQNLFVKTPSKTATETATLDDVVSIGARLNSNGKEVYFASNMLATRYISAVVGDTLTVSTDLTNDLNNHTGMMCAYDSNGNYIGQIAKQKTNWNWSSDYLSGTITIPSSIGATSYANTAKVRFGLAYTDIDNITITKT